MGIEYLQELPETLTSQQEEYLGQLIKEGGPEEKSARDQLLLHNVRLVIDLARHYIGLGIDLDDLVGFGMLGAEMACRKFDYTRGKFSVCAAFYIKNRIRNALSAHGNGMARPPHYMAGRKHMRKHDEDFQVENGRLPNDAEMAELMGVGESAIRSLRREYTQVVALDAPLTDDGVTIADTSPDEQSPKPDIEAQKEDMFNFVREQVDKLPERLKAVVKKRFGLGCEPDKLAKVGEGFGFTRERARQLEALALKRLMMAMRAVDSNVGPLNVELLGRACRASNNRIKKVSFCEHCGEPIHHRDACRCEGSISARRQQLIGEYA